MDGTNQAGKNNFADLAAWSDVSFGLWPVGDVSQARTSLGCAASSNYNNQFDDPPPAKTPPAVHLPYNFRAIARATAGSFILYLDGDTANTGNATIQVSMSHRDIKEGTGYEILTESVYDSHAHDGQFKNCNNGDNSELLVSITSVELERSREGLFTARMRANNKGGNDGVTTGKKKKLVFHIYI